MSKEVLKFNQVSFQYDKDQQQSESLLDSLSFSLSEGEFVSVIGPSGSGKSTLFRLITGLEQPSKGEIEINGEQLADRLGCVGYMPQQDLLMPWRTIMDNAVLPLELKGVTKHEAQRQVLPLLEEFGLSGIEALFPSDLSGGMKQRVSFLRTVLSGSNVLLLDEPFSALDAITRLMMQEWLIEQWKRWKKTILFITHDVDEAMFLSDRILMFSDKPVQSLKEIHVPLDRPRGTRDLSREAIVTLKEEIIEDLRTKVKL